MAPAAAVTLVTVNVRRCRISDANLTWGPLVSCSARRCSCPRPLTPPTTIAVRDSTRAGAIAVGAGAIVTDLHLVATTAAAVEVAATTTAVGVTTTHHWRLLR